MIGNWVNRVMVRFWGGETPRYSNVGLSFGS